MEKTLVETEGIPLMQGLCPEPPQDDPLAVEENEWKRVISAGPEREAFLAGTIISLSGWRRIFAPDLDEESKESRINPLAAVFSAAAATSFSRRLRQSQGGAAQVTVAMDTRPTGCAIAYNVIRALLAQRTAVRWLSVSAAPEALSFTANSPDVDGLIYITASHNPVGHNGFKFAAADGGVLSCEESERLKNDFLAFFSSADNLERLRQSILALDSIEIRKVYGSTGRYKKKALSRYREFTTTVVTGRDNALEACRELESLRERILETPIGVVAELNGSARTCSIDAEFLGSLGVRVKLLNSEPGRIAHTILPEGEALLPCCRALEEEAARDRSFELGY
ncbi:MAG: hypothetical protein U9N45_07805, partial [Gemmatimonadota bacterium]|nr:hypothetical protein [Gemmatimonadota bacterium]